MCSLENSNLFYFCELQVNVTFGECEISVKEKEGSNTTTNLET